MKSLEEILAAGGCGVFRFDGDSAAALARMTGQTPAHVRIEAPPDKRALLSALAKKLRFPEHFGANWDALHDCLTDLAQPKSAGIVIEITDLGRLSRGAPQDLPAAIETFADAARFWEERKGRFIVLLGGAGRAGADLPELARHD
jgi:RNAse (barnase) inhibitor barstar